MSINIAHRAAPLWAILAILGLLSLFAGPSGAEESRDFTYAAGLHADGGYDMAAREFGRFIDTYPSSRRLDEACYYMADSWFHLNRFDFTVELTARIRTQYPSTPLMDRVLLLEGKALAGLKRHREAIITLNQFISDYPGTGYASEALYTVAESRLALRDARQAAETFRAITGKYPGSAEADWAWYNLGTISEGEGDFRSAIESYGQVIRRYPRSGLRNLCRFRMGECYFRLADYTNTVSTMNDVVSAAVDREMKARGYFILGEANFKLGDYAQARRNYQAVCDEFPNDPLAADAREAVGWTYYQEKRFDRASEIFAATGTGGKGKETPDAQQYRQALTRKLAGDAAGASQMFAAIPDRFPESRYAERSLYELGMISWDAGQYTEGAERFQRLTSRYPKSELKPGALVMYGQCLLESKEYGAALTAFTEVTDSHRDSPSYPVALYERSFCELQQRQYDIAVMTVDRFFRSFPDHKLAPDALLVLAEARYRLGDFEGAGQACLTALGKYPQTPRLPEILYGFGWSVFRAGEYEKAAEAFSRLLERYPQSAFASDAAYRIGDCRYALGDYSGAANAYQTVLDRFPGASFAGNAAFRRGKAAFYSGDFKGALEDAELVISKYPSMVNGDEVRNLRGMCLMNMQRYPEAAEVFKSIVKPSPLADEALYQTGVCFLRAGMPDKAVESWGRLKKEFARSPRVSEAVCATADIYHGKGNDTLALEQIDDYLKRYPREKVTEGILLRKGELSIGGKRYDDAVAAFRRLIADFPSSGSVPRALYGLGVASSVKGDGEGAREAFETLAAKYPASEYAALAAKRKTGPAMEPEKKDRGGSVPEERNDEQDSVKTGDANDGGDEAEIGRGAALLRSGKTAEGEEMLRAVIDRRGADALADRARLELAEDALKRDDGDTAAELAEEVTGHRMDENAAHAQYLIGKRWFLAKDYAAAERELLKAATVYRAFGEWAARARLLTARSQVALGKREAALANLKDILAGKAGADIQKEARELQNELREKKK